VARAGQRLGHLTEDMHPAVLRLRERLLHDGFVDASDLDVHLERGDALCGACHLEIHVSQMVFVT